MMKKMYMICICQRYQVSYLRLVKTSCLIPGSQWQRLGEQSHLLWKEISGCPEAWSPGLLDGRMYWRWAEASELPPTLRPTDAGTGPHRWQSSARLPAPRTGGCWERSHGCPTVALHAHPFGFLFLPQGVTRFFSRLLQTLGSPAWPQ